MNIEYKPFPKVPRLNAGVVITEKIDGTNACVFVDPETKRIRAGSRHRWITPEDDNYGFARWVADHETELSTLAPGFHYGEWWGAGIQRRYGLAEKRFSLFTTRLHGDLPACVSLVPVLYTGSDLAGGLRDALESLRTGGSFAAYGFMRPEGVIVQLRSSGTVHKVLLENDDKPKSVTESA